MTEVCLPSTSTQNHSLTDIFLAPLLEKLEVDLSSFRKVFNLRVIYFAQLQEISDSVAQPTIETTLPDTINAIQEELQELDAKINTSKARHRYLAHLAEVGNVQSEDDDDDDRACILCRHDFILGFITPWYEHCNFRVFHLD